MTGPVQAEGGAKSDVGIVAADVRPLDALQRLLVAVDGSDHANRGLAEAVRLALANHGTVAGIHAYAARLHDRRFREMESGLPERYRKEAELEHQRAVHDDLITRGLGIISDGYHEGAEKECQSAGLAYRGLSPEGKNYRCIVETLAGGDFDLLVMGALGLGLGPGAPIGSVCERVTRRSPIDVLVIRDPTARIGDGPIVVGLDGSARSFGALKLALDLGRRLDAPVHAVAAYDPYFHYAAFKRIAGVLSEEKGRLFRFNEQEKLHEELIDDGLAKIYQSHLEIAREIAAADNTEIHCALLDGKPYRAIQSYLRDTGASLLLIGKTGIHADPDLDIGGTAENLVRAAPCQVWLTVTTFTPPLETIARETVRWTEEAEGRLTRVPETVRAVVRGAILRFACQRGHTVVTSRVVDEATAAFCPHMRAGAAEERPLDWSPEASTVLDAVADASMRMGVRLRAEKKARREGRSSVTAADVVGFLAPAGDAAPRWEAGALARLARVPEMVRASVAARIEADVADAGEPIVTLDAVEHGLADSRRTMSAAMRRGGHGRPDRNHG